MGIKMTTMFILALYDKNGGCDIKALQSGGTKISFMVLCRVTKHAPRYCLEVSQKK